MKDDKDVTAEDARRFHLILFGDPGSNSWIARVLPRLPVRWTREECAIGSTRVPAAGHALVLVQPNPLAEGRYVVLNSGHTFHEKELDTLNYLLFPRLGDWAVVKVPGEVPDDPTKLTGETVVRSGFFDERWSLSTREDDGEKLDQRLAPSFRVPTRYADDAGRFRSPLKFLDGSPVRNSDDWVRRRREILRTWHEAMGPWPKLLEKPTIEYMEEERRDGLTQHHVRLEVAPGRTTDDAYLLIPAGDGPFPAVLVVFYEAGTGIGRGKPGRLDFALQLARRGFVTLSLGSDPAASYPDKDRPELQPLSFHAYMAANGYNALANLPRVDAGRVGVLGHSYGGKWALMGIGGSLAAPPLPHHRAYGSVPRRFDRVQRSAV